MAHRLSCPNGEENNMKKRTIARIMAAVMSIAMLSGCGSSGNGGAQKVKLDPDHPVSIKIWHYYNGTQQATFDSLVEKFNATKGKDEGIYVESYSYGSVSDLEQAVSESLAGSVGAEDLPDIFSSYADTAYAVQKENKLTDLTQYFSDDELSGYVDSYIQEGYFAQDDSLYLLPVAKSTEIMMINKTDWDKFASATGSSLDELSTIEGVVSVAEKYYDWTDAQTPDIANDGKAFYGRDAMANYFVIGMKQMGKEIFEVENGKVTFNTDKELVKRLWDNYYVPYVKGYFAAYGKFRSDDVKTGDIIAYTGSTSSTFYFPDTVETDDASYPIEYIVQDAPIMEGGENYKVQQGAGMAVTKSDKEHEYASCEFLKWFTEKENNLRFVCDSGYFPVLKEANNIDELDKVIEENNIEVNDKAYACIKQVMGEFESTKFYTTKNFDNGYDARNVLNYNMADAAAEARDAVTAAADDASRKAAIEKYTSDEAFDEWYDGFNSALQEAAGSQ